MKHGPRKVLMGAVKAYRLLLKPWLGNACRFEPSCSAYALQALEQHGAGGGTALALWRLARCHPWCQGGVDPVPPEHPARRLQQVPGLQGLFTRWVQANPRREESR